MRNKIAKLCLLSIVALVFLLGLITFASSRPALSVSILSPKFRLLTARISHGTTHELAKASWPVSQLSKLLRLVGLNVVVPLQLPPTPEDSFALVARFTGDFAPNELSGVKAELLDASGTVTLLRSQAAYVSARNQYEYGRIWLLDAPLTNAITIRLRPGIGEPPLAEIRVEAQRR